MTIGPSRGAGAPERTAPATPTSRPAAVPPAESARVRPSGGGQAPEPPPGTDPVLWSVLTAEERAYFAQAASLGPLTYGPARAAEAPSGAPRGQRIDVRA